MFKPMAKSAMSVSHVAEPNPASAKGVFGASRDVHLKLNAVVAGVGRISGEIEGRESRASVCSHPDRHCYAIGGSYLRAGELTLCEIIYGKSP